MSEKELSELIDKSKMIVNGYSFYVNENGFIEIINIMHPDCEMIINKQCELIETNMDDIEQSIVLSIAQKNLQFLEEEDA